MTEENAEARRKKRREKVRDLIFLKKEFDLKNQSLYKEGLGGGVGGFMIKNLRKFVKSNTNKKQKIKILMLKKFYLLVYSFVV